MSSSATLTERAQETSVAVRRPLRLGLLVDGLVQPAWVERVVRELTSTGVTELALVVLNAGPAASASEAPAPAPVGDRAPLSRVRRLWATECINRRAWDCPLSMVTPFSAPV